MRTDHMPEEESGDFSYADDAELVEQFVTWTTDAVDELKAIVADLDGSELKSDDKAARIYDLTHKIQGDGGEKGMALQNRLKAIISEDP